MKRWLRDGAEGCPPHPRHRSRVARRVTGCRPDPARWLCAVSSVSGSPGHRPRENLENGKFAPVTPAIAGLSR